VRIGWLVGELARLSRISRRPLDRVPLDLSALAESVGRDLRAAHPEQSIDLRVAPGVHASGDALLVRTVLENLLGNAWKFSAGRTNPRVWVGAADAPRGRAFFVRDEGVGFDPARARELFTPLRRLHGDAYPGTGMGLASVMRVVRRHGGTAWAESTPGAGATFWFTLGPTLPLTRG
jgi:signal transduction histidine kinase